MSLERMAMIVGIAGVITGLGDTAVQEARASAVYPTDRSQRVAAEATIKTYNQAIEIARPYIPQEALEALTQAPPLIRAHEVKKQNDKRMELRDELLGDRPFWAVAAAVAGFGIRVGLSFIRDPRRRRITN